MVIWPAFRMEKYRVNDHPYHAPQFMSFINPLQKLFAISYLSYYIQNDLPKYSSMCAILQKVSLQKLLNVLS